MEENAPYPEESRLLRDYETTTRVSLAFLSRLGSLEWNRPSLCAGWTVADVVAHLLGVLQLVWTALAPPISGVVESFELPADRNAGMLLEQLNSSSGVALAALKKLTQRELSSVVAVRSVGTMPFGLALYFFMFELFTHTNDILGAFRERGAYVFELLPPALLFLKHAPLTLVSTERIENVDVSYGWMFGQDPELRWVTTFKSGKVRVAQWTGEKPDVQIQGDPATFILIFVLGKGSRLRALLTRRVKVRGSLIALRKLPTFFPKLDS